MMTMQRRQFAAAAGLALACGLATSTSALAQVAATKPVTLVVPFAPGGPTDAMARNLANAIKAFLPQGMIVENKAGAGGNIGAEQVSRSAADGNTLLFGTSGPLAINVSLYGKVGYDPIKSFEPVIHVGHLPNVLVVHPSVPAQNVRELIAFAKANPGKLTYASSGNGASSHLAGVLFNDMAGTKLVHVPFKGTGPALNALLAGQVDMTFTDILTAMPYIQSDKFKALGMTTAQRSRAMAAIPTVAEQGLKGFDVSVFFGVVAPKGTPADRVKRLNQAFARALAAPKVSQTFVTQGLEAAPDTSPAYLSQLIRSEVDKWAKVVQQSGVQLD